ncbi:hypothetical protein Pmani_024883 [Petrolisthes manimaculis]|uniref:Tetraspanin n=1 Tax=Petrolisthes manimaculis TaxID=1843537 RepID=A0AAE1TZK0_9EUCA|nr:hypothetical protein Pmani_024883 [Petrolisthes manimaculis]
MGLWTRFDKDMDEYVNSLGMYFYWHGTTVIMVGATIVMITSFMACCGAYFKNRALLIAYKVFTVIAFIMLLGGSAYILDHGMEDTKLFPWVQRRMRELIHQYQWDVSARRTVDIVQEYVGCCGGYSASDYTDIHLPIPDTCRNQVSQSLV